MPSDLSSGFCVFATRENLVLYFTGAAWSSSGLFHPLAIGGGATVLVL